MTLNPPAEYGQTGLGITKLYIEERYQSIHGTVYEYLRNAKLDARVSLLRKRPKTTRTNLIHCWRTHS